MSKPFENCIEELDKIIPQILFKHGATISTQTITTLYDQPELVYMYEILLNKDFTKRKMTQEEQEAVGDIVEDYEYHAGPNPNFSTNHELLGAISEYGYANDDWVPQKLKLSENEALEGIFREYINNLREERFGDYEEELLEKEEEEKSEKLRVESYKKIVDPETGISHSWRAEPRHPRLPQIYEPPDTTPYHQQEGRRILKNYMKYMIQ